MRAVSATDSLIGRDAGRAGLAAAGGQRRVAGGDLQVSGADGGSLDGRRGVVAVAGAAAGRAIGAGEGGADGGGPELGEGGQGGVPA